MNGITDRRVDHGDLIIIGHLAAVMATNRRYRQLATILHYIIPNI